MLMKKISLFTAALLVLLCGCVPQEEWLRNPVDSSSGAAFSDIVIGVALPLSGKHAVAGSNMLPGAQMAVDDINQSRGISGRRVKLEICDTRSTPDGAEHAMKVLAEKGATVVVGGYSTHETTGLSSGAQRERIPLIVPCATADDISKKNPFVFRTSYTDTQQAEGLSAYLWYWRQIRKIGVLIDMRVESEYERNIARAAAQSFSALGGMVMHTANYTDIPSCVNAMKSVMQFAPQAIVVTSIGKEAAMMIKALRQLGFSGVICGADGWDRDDFFTTLGTYSNLGECIYVTPFSNEYKDDEYAVFAEKFRKKFYCLPGMHASVTRDAVIMAGSCVMNCGDVRDFRRNWLALQNFFGTSSIYNPKPSGDVDRMIFINTVVPSGMNSKFPGVRLIRSFMHSKLESYKFD